MKVGSERHLMTHRFTPTSLSTDYNGEAEERESKLEIKVLYDTYLVRIDERNTGNRLNG